MRALVFVAMLVGCAGASYADEQKTLKSRYIRPRESIAALFEIEPKIAQYLDSLASPNAEWLRLKPAVDNKIKDKKRELDRLLNEMLDNAVEFVWEGGFNLSSGNSVLSFRIDVTGTSPELRVTGASLNMQQSAQAIA